MSNGRTKFQPRKGISFTPPKIGGGGGSSGENLLAGYMLGQRKSREAKEQLGEGAIPTGARLEGVTYKTKAGMLAAAGEDVLKTGSKELAKKFGMAARTIGSMRNLYGYAKNIESEYKNPITGRKGAGAAAQITSDIASTRYAPAFLQKQSEPMFRYVSQMEEVRMSMVPILSGQARYVVELANAIAKTIPDVGKIFPVKDDLISQSTRNIMTLTYAVENGTFNDQFLARFGISPDESLKPGDKRADALLDAVQLTPEQEQNIEEAIRYVRESPELGSGSQVVGQSPIPGMDKSADAGGDFERERQLALDAIQKQGQDAKKVAEIFRQRTGRELNG